MSSVGDLHRSREEWEGDADDELGADTDGDTDEEEKDELGENGGEEAEEDFTLKYVLNSPDDDEEDEDEVTPRMKPVGIVYYHTNSTQIHITLKTTPVQSRKGKGNTSTVFKARGPVYLNPVTPQSTHLSPRTTVPSQKMNLK
ncbi:hypothetical protein AAF712_011285 [Marasmius tenuissimus]|uniref:Uncharacterized protein n=1 Tax=Marasmius tenuissimus TaxID=585030 RepID=A0ABR2ZKI6_9AGAR